MSRRLPTSPLVGVLLLLFAGAILTPLLALPASAFGERVYEQNKVINGTNHLDVYVGQRVAQSFVATEAYRLLNVTLRLRNMGDTTDPLNVTIRPDASGMPAVEYVAHAELVIGNNNLGNYDVPFPSPPVLEKGARYWIAATSSSLTSNEYEWHHSAADVYASGQAKVSFGGGWVNPATPTDMYFVTYGKEVEGNLTATILALQSNGNPGDLVTFRVYLNNTGESAAPIAWLNDTGLPGFVNVSDTAEAAGSSTPWPSFTFLDVGSGARSFTITARIQIGTEPGTLLTKALSLTYVKASGEGAAAPGTQANVLVGRQTKQLYLNPQPVGSSERLTPIRPTGDATSQFNETVRKDGSAHNFDLAPVLARDFRVYGVDVTLYLDSSSHKVEDLDINLTFSDWNGVTLTPLAYVQARIKTNPFSDYQPFTFAFPGIDHAFPSGGRIRLTVRNMGTSDTDAILAMNSAFASSRLDMETTTYVRIELLDLRDGIGSTMVWSPKDAIVVQANVSDPFGSPEIPGARVNVTSPSGALVVNNTAMVLVATDSGSPSAWKLFQFTYGPPLSEGVYGVRVTARESNGVVDIAEGSALVRVPRFTLAKTSTMTNVGSGDAFRYDIWYNNTGPGIAGRVWINDTLPNELNFVSSSDPAAMTGSYNWTWTTLTPGNYRLSIDVQVKSSLPPIPYLRNFVFLNYTDEKGFLWPVRSTYADVAVHGPVISLSKRSAGTVLHANETVVYTITMQNTGDTAQKLWLNDTLPDGLTYVSDTASSPPLGGTRIVSGQNLYFRFSNMPALSTWSFTLSAVAGPALVRGSTLTNLVSLEYTNSNGFFLPPRNTSWAVVVFAPAITSASVTIARAQATPADLIPAMITFANVGNEPARDAWVNLTLDPGLFFVNASLPAFTSGDQVRFALTNVALGVRVIYLNASLDPRVVDHQTLSIRGTLSYTDGFGNGLPIVPLTADSVEAAAPVLFLSVTPSMAWVEADTIAFFNIYQVNAGSGVAGDIWLTLPLPASFVYVSDTSDLAGATRTVVGSTHTWHWTDAAPGPMSFSLQLRARSSVPNGTFADLVFHADYTDANGNLRNGTTSMASVRFRAPQIEFELSATPLIARPGDTIMYSLTVRNLGNSTIRNLWLSDVLDPRFAYVSFTARVSVTVTGQSTLNWSFTDVAPNQSETVTLVLRINDPAKARDLIPNAFEVVYTNSAGNVIGYGRSNTVDVQIADDPVPFAYVGAGGLALGLLAALVLVRRMHVEIEEVFLVYRDGVLIYHLSRSLSQDKDEDVLGGMLTAVQEFVRDAFVYGEHRELHQLDFGDYRILIERGKNLYLAVVYSGKGTTSVRKKVRAVLNEMEIVYGQVLEKWDGDMDKVVGARDLIREYLLKSNGRRGKSALRAP